MSLYNQKNVLHVMVGKNTTAIANGVVVDNYADLVDGDVVILDMDNVVHETVSGAAITADTQYRFATRVGDQLIYSPIWKPKDIISIKARAYAAAVQQVTYLGYIGSGTGNIEAIDSNEYIVRILIEGTTSMFGNKQMYKFGAYKSSASATSAEIAIGLVDNFYYNFKREPQSLIKFDTICSATVTAANGMKSGQEVTVVNGLNYVTCETDVTYTSGGGSTLVVGDYLRLGTAAGANGAVAQGSAVYQVTKIDNLTVYLDRPVTVASGTYDDAGGTTACEVIPSATGLAAQWGIKCTGVAQTNFKAGVFNYHVPRFKVEPENCGITTVTYSTAASEGAGVYGQIAELEWFAQGNLGLKYRVDTPPVTLHTQASSASTYETIAIKYKINPSSTDSVTATTPPSHGEIILAFVVNSDSGDKIIATLTEWAAANLGYSVAW